MDVLLERIFVDAFLIRAGKIPRPAYSQLGVSSQDGDFLFMAASPRGSFVGADFCGCVFDTSGKNPPSRLLTAGSEFAGRGFSLHGGFAAGKFCWSGFLWMRF